MKKKIRIVIAVLAVAGGIGAFVAYRMWNTPHRDINSEPADFKSEVTALATEFAAGAPAAEKKYSNKVVELSGVVEKNTPGDSLTSIALKGNEAYGLLVEMLPEQKDLATKAPVGKSVKIKAFYQGFMEGEVDFGMPGDILFKKGVIVE